MSVCDTHKTFSTRQAAQRRCDALKKIFEATGTDKTYKRLNVFRCGNHWHVGRRRYKRGKDKRGLRRYVDRLFRECMLEVVRDILAECAS